MLHVAIHTGSRFTINGEPHTVTNIQRSIAFILNENTGKRTTMDLDDIRVRVLDLEYKELPRRNINGTH